MNKSSIVLVGVVCLIIGVLIAPNFQRYNNPGMGMHQMPDGGMMNGSMMQHEMSNMMAGLSGKTGDEFDKAFLTEMIVHHEGAVEMAEAVLAKGKHEELKVMANAIITAQAGEINQMKKWLMDWYNIK